MITEIQDSEQRQESGQSRHSIRELARRVYAMHRCVSEAAVMALIESAEDEGRGRDLQELAARLLLDQERRNGNKPVYAKAQALSSLSVEEPPAGYHQPNQPVRERVSSLESVMTGDDQRRGYTGRRPVAALRAFLGVTIKVDGRAVQPARLRREDMLPYAEQLERQGRGCFDHAALMRDLWAVTRPGERGLEAVRRLESAS